MDALRRELIHRIQTTPDEEIAVLHAFFCGKTSTKVSDNSYSKITENINELLRSYSIGRNLDGYEFLRTALHIIFERPSAFVDSVENVYDLVGQEHDCPGPFIELVINNLLLSASQTYPSRFKEFPTKSPAPTSSEFLAFALKQIVD